MSTSSSTYDDPRTRGNLTREALLMGGVLMVGAIIYLLLYRQNNLRDIADIRNGLLAARMDATEAQRTASGVGSSLDELRDDQKTREAEVSGQLSVIWRIGGVVGAVLTAVLIAYMLAWLNLK